MRTTSLMICLLLVTCTIATLKSRGQEHHPKPNSLKLHPKVQFCELPNQVGKTVEIEAAYSGVDEYWGLNSLKGCKNKMSVELDYYVEGKPIPTKFQPLFDSAYSTYWKTYLIINATGRYENSNPKGYGHLGSNKSKFVVDSILSVKLVSKQELD